MMIGTCGRLVKFEDSWRLVMIETRGRLIKFEDSLEARDDQELNGDSLRSRLVGDS